ncbi:MAG: adenylate kinase [Bacteroidetes bacterium]|nr:MAG: adenylate kinase [Bacteroidota bacterium]
MLNIVLFGPPGSGKGTQSDNLVKQYNLVHLSTGDIFRANIKGETELGRLAKSYMDKGNLVPDDVTIRMLESVVNEHPSAAGFIFDGFPRTTAQAEALDKFLESKGTSVTMMLALEVDDEELKRRIIERGKISGRVDDQDPATVENRIREYNTKTAPLKNFFSAQGKFRGVDGMRTIDEVFVSLCSTIDKEKRS